MKPAIIMSGILLVLLGIYAHSVELEGSFEAKALQCELSATGLQVRNTSNSTATYALGVSGAETNWFSVIPGSVTLGPGDSATARVFAIAGCYASPGNYSADIFVSGNGEKATRKFSLELEQGHFVGIRLLEASQSATQGEEKIYAVELTNNTLVPNQSIERVDLSVHGLPSTWYSIDEPRVLVEKGNPKQAKIRVKAPIDAELGDYEFTARASLPNPEFYSETKATHSIRQGQEFRAILPEEAVGGTVSACLEEKTKAIVKVQNAGKQDDNLKLKLEGPKFVSLGQNNVSIGKGKESQIGVLIDPEGEKAGDYNFTVRIESAVYDYSASKEFNVKLLDCYGVEVEKLEGSENACTGETPVYRFRLNNDRAKPIELNASLTGISGKVEPEKITIQNGAQAELKATLDVNGYAKEAKAGRSDLAAELIIDTSGSMSEKQGSVQKMEIARSEIIKLVNSISAIDFGMRVIGQGSLCEPSELVVPLKKLDIAAVAKKISMLEPRGKTPLVQGLSAAANDFPPGKEKAIILVSDGKETCDGNIESTASELAKKGIAVYAIGFDIDREGKAQLEKIAGATKGGYFEAQDSNQLSSVLAEVSKELDIAAGSKGRRTFTISLESEKFSFEKDYSMEVSDCHNAAMALPELYICPGAEKNDTITIANLGTQQQEFALAYSPKWVSGPASVSVGPNSKKSIQIKASLPKGDSRQRQANLVVNAASQGLSVSREAPIHYLQDAICYGIDLLLPESEIDAAACEGKRQKLYIENRGMVEQEVSLSTDKAYTKLTEGTINVGPGERKEVDFFVTPPFDLPETTFITISAETNNGFSTEAKAKLVVKGNQDSFGTWQPDIRVRDLNVSTPKGLNYNAEIEIELFNDSSKPMKVFNAVAKGFNAVFQMPETTIPSGKAANARLLVGMPADAKSGSKTIPLMIETSLGTFTRDVEFDYNAAGKTTDANKNSKDINSLVSDAASKKQPDENKAGKLINDSNGTGRADQNGEIAQKEKAKERIVVGTGLFNLADFTTAALIGLVALVILLIGLSAYNAVQEEKEKAEKEEKE
ncbi:Uncharacterised protein [uncultured archaeon]|nr:Uncharacterised protein [uncultured archaeon]